MIKGRRRAGKPFPNQLGTPESRSVGKRWEDLWLGRFGSWETAFQFQNRIFQLEELLLTFEFFAIRQMLKVSRKLVQSLLDFIHFFPQMRYFTA